MKMGIRQAEVAEERLGHGGVVVLPRVHKDAFMSGFFERRQNGRYFHEVRSGTGDD
jgi:hypothetical protein